jgi:sugar lactone lactonase YvrE
MPSRPDAILIAPEIPEKSVDIIADYNDLCGECPVWDPDAGVLYWTDSVGLRFYRYDPRTGKHEIVKSGLEINGFRLNRSGGFVIANNSGIWFWDGAQNPKLIAGEVDGSKCQVNDCISDPEGRFYAGSNFYNPDGKYETGKLIRVDTGGKASILDDGIHLANGFGFSPDLTTLYFTDSIARRIYAYDYDRATGNVKNRRILVQVPRTEGIPDGLTVDTQGFLWSAQWYGSCVARYDPDGKLERRIDTPAKQTSCMTFGGDGYRDLFITSAAESWASPAMPPGYDPHAGLIGGPLYRTTVDVPGRPEFKTNLSLNA